MYSPPPHRGPQYAVSVRVEGFSLGDGGELYVLGAHCGGGRLSTRFASPRKLCAQIVTVNGRVVTHVASAETIEPPLDNFSFSCPRVIGRRVPCGGGTCRRMTTGGGERSPIPNRAGLKDDGLTFTSTFI